MLKLRYYLMAAFYVGVVGVALWAAYIFTPYGSPNALPSARDTLWTGVVCMVLTGTVATVDGVIRVRKGLKFARLYDEIIRVGGKDTWLHAIIAERDVTVAAYKRTIVVNVARDFDEISTTYSPRLTFSYVERSEILLDPASTEKELLWSERSTASLSQSPRESDLVAVIRCVVDRNR